MSISLYDENFKGGSAICNETLLRLLSPCAMAVSEQMANWALYLPGNSMQRWRLGDSRISQAHSHPKVLSKAVVVVLGELHEHISRDTHTKH